MPRSRVLLLSALMVGCAGDDGAASESESSATSGSTGGSTAEVSTGMTDGTGTTGTTGTTADSTSTGSTSDETSTTADSDATTTSTTGDDGIAPDFGLLDVNESSASFDEVVSPRDYLEKVSGWYFAHAT